MAHANAQFPLAPSLFIVKVMPHFHPFRMAGRFFRLRGAARRRFSATAHFLTRKIINS
jgi:hypothetical protein